MAIHYQFFNKLLDQKIDILVIEMRSLIIRKKNHTNYIFRRDYFVVQHLFNFISSSIEQYCHKGFIVADIGCGEQPWRQLIERRGGRYLGIDYNQNQQSSVNILANIEQLPLIESSFDMILCTEVVEHVLRPDLALSELCRTLKPNGILIITTPFAYPLHEEPFDFCRLTKYYFSGYSESIGLSTIKNCISGNEIEVIATIWSHIWRTDRAYYLKGYKRLIIMGFGAMMSVVGNLIAKILTLVFGKYLPKKYYLNNLLIFQKKS